MENTNELLETAAATAQPHTTDTPLSPEERLKTEERIVEILKTVYDPEIPVDIYNLGLIYRIDLHDDRTLEVDMTLTAPNCPAADFIVEDVRLKLDGMSEIRDARVNLVFEPEWDKDMMSEEAKLELGFL
ncbi:MAG: metal-sulfur cluster assembly factor [Alloprevotella sp.]